jgi:GNAT superfamily N-acetyltransferase
MRVSVCACTALVSVTRRTWEGLSLYLEGAGAICSGRWAVRLRCLVRGALADLFVRKEARGKGAGMALMKAVAAVAKREDCRCEARAGTGPRRQKVKE